MKNVKYCLITLLLMLINIYPIYADCTKDQIMDLKEEIDKIEITYKHLGEVIKDDGSKTYNEFLVTAKNIPENVYVHLSPMAEEEFDETGEDLKIKLISGVWEYNLYSSECEEIIDTIIVKLPTFNEYSLDPLCEGVDGNDFKLCGKYYESTVDRETFERRVKIYRNEKKLDEKKEIVNNNNFFDNIINFINSNLMYVIVIIGIVILIVATIIIVNSRKSRKVLQ